MALTPTQEAQVVDLLTQLASLQALADNEPAILSALGATSVTLTDLTSAGAVNTTDLMLIRQGFSDRKITTGDLSDSLFFGATIDAKFLKVAAGGNTPLLNTYGFYSDRTSTEHAYYGFIENGTVNYAGGAPLYGHASFNDNVKFTGAVNSDHHHSFQSYPHYGNSGTIGVFSSFWSQLDVTAGTVTEASGVKINNPLGAGTITAMYGVLIDDLTRGGSNWGVFSKTPNNALGRRCWFMDNGNVPMSYIEYNSTLGHMQLVPRAGYNIKIGALSGDRKLRIGDPTTDAEDAVLENRGDGNLEITPRSGFSIILSGPAVEVQGVLAARGAPIIIRTYTVATLPSAVTFIASRCFVSDSSVTTFNSVVAGGGGALVPVFSDGTNWKVG